MNSVSISYKADDEWHGELTGWVHCEEFTGKGSAWFSISQMQEFGQALGAFPIEAGREPLLEGGFWKEGQLDQVHVRIQIEPIGQRGMLVVDVQLAKPTLPENTADTRSEIRVQFHVTYGDLARFQSSLRDHINGLVTEAVLEQSPS